MNATKTTYLVIKTIPSHPGPGNRTSVPESEVVMSRHRTERAALTALRRYERDHRGYAAFRISKAV